MRDGTRWWPREGSQPSPPVALLDQLIRPRQQSVLRKTGYVVVGKDPGSKADDARRLGVSMLDEDAFFDFAAHLPTLLARTVGEDDQRQSLNGSTDVIRSSPVAGL